jgi:hypothetical protein
MAKSVWWNRRTAQGSRMTETPTITAPPETILLGAYAARSCPVKTQNAFNPLVDIDTTNAAAEAHAGQANDELSELFYGGAQFEEAVLEQLIASCTGRVVDLRPLAANTREVQIEACVRAMTSGAQVIIAGRLPADLGGHRVGIPDLLIRSADTANGSPAYHPVEVKWHRILLRPRPQEGARRNPTRCAIRH